MDTGETYPKIPGKFQNRIKTTKTHREREREREKERERRTNPKNSKEDGDGRP